MQLDCHRRMDVEDVDMNEFEKKQIIERLRQSKKRREQEDRAEWRQYGSDWALHGAEYDELKRVAEMTELSSDPDELLVDIAREVWGEEPDSDKIDVFTDAVLGDYIHRKPSLAQLEGWLEGVRDAWERLKDEI